MWKCKGRPPFYISEEGAQGTGETGVETASKKREPEEIEMEEIGEEGPDDSDEVESISSGEPKEPKKERQPSLRLATPNAVVKRLKFGDAGVTCCLDHLGEEGPGCMTEGTIIYINRDHPLYKREANKREAHILNNVRLLTQEISLMKDPGNPREAYNRQSKLLRDAFREHADGLPKATRKKWTML